MIISGINRAVLRTPTVNGEVLEPLPVNFFYGKNGVGKTSIAKLLANPTEEIQWSEDLPNGAQVFLYNRETIDRIIRSSSLMPGVYTLSEENVAIQKQIEEKTSEAEEMTRNIQSMKENLEKQRGWHEQDRKSTLKSIWRTTADIRKRYPEVISEYGTDIERFATHLREFNGKNCEQEEMDICYRMAYGRERVDCEYIEEITVKSFPVCDMLDIPIVSHSNAALSVFYSTLGSMDWAKRGYDDYQHSAGCKCPYCGQDLPADFRERFEECLDKQYREKMTDIQNFRNEYQKAVEETERILATNLKNPFVEGTAYPALSELLIERLKGNLDIIDQKIQAPVKEFQLKEITSVLNQMKQVTENINKKVHHRFLAEQNLPAAKERVSQMVWSTMAEEAKDLLEHFFDESDKKKLRIMELNIGTSEGKHARLIRAIQDLKASATDITAVMEEINKALASNGFVGFHFEKKDSQHYAVVRDDGSPAADLSEGERGIVAFMYYMHSVLNSTKVDAGRENKVVIIDDPVCSLDSEAMTYVVGMMKCLVNMCLSRYITQNEEGQDSTILQIFCFTHNPFFFRSVSDSYLGDSKHCAFYRIKKGSNNVTSVERCLEADDMAAGEVVNKSPVEDEYRMLWRDYIEGKRPQELLRTARQILTHYFLFTCYYDANEMKRILLEENKESFIMPGCVDWQSSFNIISAMVSMMSGETASRMQDLYFDIAALNCTQIRFVFERIFEVMHQEQHFRYMTKMVK